MPKFVLQYPTFPTKQRMKEVHFWFAIKTLYFRHHKRLRTTEEEKVYIENLLETFCRLHSINYQRIIYAIEKFNHPHYRPSPLEAALTNYYLNFPIDIIKMVYRIGHPTLTKSIKNYIKAGSPDVNPRFENEITLEMEKFVKALNFHFLPLKGIVKMEELVYNKEGTEFTEEDK